MARDYKNVKRRSGDTSALGTVAGFVLGLAFGLAVAMAVYLYDRRPSARLAQQPAPASPMTPDDEAQNDGKTGKPAPASQNPEAQFDFYEMLPKFEVVIPEKEGTTARTAAGGAVAKPGAYILQAGSFRNLADADRVRALIALQGVESKIQKVTIDTDTWHRVRIGPITDLRKLEETRSKLRQAQIEALVIRVGE